MEREFEEIEVLKVLKALNINKAAGPDVFSLATFQTYWEVNVGDLMKVFRDLYMWDLLYTISIHEIISAFAKVPQHTCTYCCLFVYMYSYKIKITKRKNKVTSSR